MAWFSCLKPECNDIWGAPSGPDEQGCCAAPVSYLSAPSGYLNTQKHLKLHLAPLLRHMNHCQSDCAVKLGIADTCLKLGGIKLGHIVFYGIHIINTRDSRTRYLQSDTRDTAPCLALVTETQKVFPGEIQSPRFSSVIQMQRKAIPHISQLRPADTYYSIYTNYFTSVWSLAQNCCA